MVVFCSAFSLLCEPCRCDLLCSLIAKVHPRALNIVGVCSGSRWTMCSWFSIKCIPWSLLKLQFYIHIGIELYFKDLII